MPSKLMLSLMFVFAGVFAFAQTSTTPMPAPAPAPTTVAMASSPSSAPGPAAAPLPAESANIHAPNSDAGVTPGLLLSSLERGTGVCYSTENCSGAQIASGVKQEWCDNASATHSWLSANGNCFH